MQKLLVKFVYAVSIVYVLNLALFNVLNFSQLKRLLIYFDPELSKPAVNRSYAMDCRLYVPESEVSKFPNLMSTMDIYISAHFFGWLGKALIFRNNIVLWIMSIGFEILELSLK